MILFILLAFLLLLSFFFFKEESYSDPKLDKGIEPNFDIKGFEPGKEYVRTLGDWGKLAPSFCFQYTPEKDALNSENDGKDCNACKLMCSSKEAWDRCQLCLKVL